MKQQSVFFLILFVTFLVTPVVVSYLNRGDKVLVVSVLEEENTGKGFNQNFEKDVKLISSILIINTFLTEQKTALFFHNNSIECSVYLDPVSPPPRLV
ncbi:hypothetical protein [Leeuwenhoekiella sp. MAR_2009_132]|uniref:hypothetical protein n=1 Tax=Leeuwenhoekiella sp. MAR_2009_132 TaxID=1392489 RepID=UPI000F675D8E|nr:hypothetical protein [Leeuwenhoekiella sp. MAR_2009_132]